MLKSDQKQSGSKGYPEERTQGGAPCSDHSGLLKSRTLQMFARFLPISLLVEPLLLIWMVSYSQQNSFNDSYRTLSYSGGALFFLFQYLAYSGGAKFLSRWDTTLHSLEEYFRPGFSLAEFKTTLIPLIFLALAGVGTLLNSPEQALSGLVPLILTIVIAFATSKDLLKAIELWRKEKQESESFERSVPEHSDQHDKEIGGSSKLLLECLALRSLFLALNCLAAQTSSPVKLSFLLAGLGYCLLTSKEEQVVRYSGS